MRGSNYLLNFPIFVHNVTAARSNVDRFLSHNCGSRVESFIRGVGSGLWRGWGREDNGAPAARCANVCAAQAAATAAATPQHKHFNASNLLSCRTAPRCAAQKIPP